MVAERLNYCLKATVIFMWYCLYTIQIFYYTRYITPKRVTSLHGPSPHHCTPQQRSFRRNVAAVASRSQDCAQVHRPEI